LRWARTRGKLDALALALAQDIPLFTLPL